MAKAIQNPAHPLGRLTVEFYLLVAEPLDVELIADKCIQGRFGERESERRVPARVLDDFINCSDKPEDILAFTKRYGPLFVTQQPYQSGERLNVGHPKLTPTPGEQWELPLDLWRWHQDALRKHWVKHGRETGRPLLPLYINGKWQPKAEALTEGQFKHPELYLNCEDVIHFHQSKNRVLVQVSTLLRFLTFSVSALPHERLRVCKRSKEDAPGCPGPYFIAKDLRQLFCSDHCAHWGLRAAKRDWWRERRKKERRKKQKRRESKKP